MNNHSEHLDWIHNRIIEVYGERENVDFLIKFREIIKTIKSKENSSKDYLKFIEEKN